MGLLDVPKNLQRVQKEYDTGQRNLLEWAIGTGYYGLAEPIESAVGDVMQYTGIPQAIQYGLDQTTLDERMIEKGYEVLGDRGMRNVEEGLGLLGGMSGLRSVAKFPKEAEKLSKNLPNQMPGFYSGGVERMKATGKGLARGMRNYLRQTMTPQGNALFNQMGVSKTFEDAMQNRGVLGDSQREKFGQAAHELLISKQYGSLSPVLSKLEDDYFTYTGVMDIDDFKSQMKLPEDDTNAFFRTVMANWKVKNDGKAIMVVRKDKHKAESSGDMRYSVQGSKDFNKIRGVFFDDSQKFNADKLINSYTWSETGKAKKRELTPKDKLAIKEIFKENPELADMPFSQLAKELDKPKYNSRLSEGLGFKTVLGKAGGEQRKKYESNDDVVRALVASGVDPARIKRNRDQSNDPDVYFSSSLVSSMQELGGVNVVYKVDKDGKVTAVVSDDYDLFGVRGPNSQRLITVLEPMKFDLSSPESESRIAKAIKSNESKKPTKGLERVEQEFAKGVTPTRADTLEALENQAAAGVAVAQGVKEEQEERGN